MERRQCDAIEEMIMIIPTKMCRKMDVKFVDVILKDLSDQLAKHHYFIMKMLLEKGSSYVMEIVSELAITKSQMTASINKLIELGYVKRSAELKDRRKLTISLTASGREITETISNRMRVCFRRDLAVLNQKELDALQEGLAVLVRFCKLNEAKSEEIDRS